MAETTTRKRMSESGTAEWTFEHPADRAKRKKGIGSPCRGVLTAAGCKITLKLILAPNQRSKCFVV